MCPRVLYCAPVATDAHTTPALGATPQEGAAALSQARGALTLLTGERRRDESARRISSLLDRRASCGLTVRELADSIGRGSYVGDEAA